jgi:chromodomain-helicase-DNA-binding protein 4
MGNDTKVSRKGKDEESNDIKGRNIGNRSSSSLGAANDTFGLRKSARETSFKKNLTPSPSSSRKSERIEKQTPPAIPPVTRKSERLVEKQSLPTPSRRPEKGKNQSSSSSSGSTKCGKSSGSLIMKEKHKKEKSVKQLETEEVGNTDKPVIKTVLVGIKRMDARAYRELFKQKQKKAKLEGSQDLIVNRTPGVDTEVKSGCKVMSSKQKRSIDDLNFDATEMVSNEDGDAAPYECGRTDSVDSCSERQRLKKRNKVSNNNTDSPSLKAALIGNWLVSLLINCSGFVPYPVCTDGTLLRVLGGKHCGISLIFIINLHKMSLLLHELLELQCIRCVKSCQVQVAFLTQLMRITFPTSHI